MKPSRRTLFAGAVALPVAGAAAIASAPDAAAELLRLARALPAIHAANEAVHCRLSDAEGTPAEAALMLACDVSTAELEGAIDSLAALPALSMTGIAAKAARLAWSVSINGGLMAVEHALADSLCADFARLAPELLPARPARDGG